MAPIPGKQDINPTLSSQDDIYNLMNHQIDKIIITDGDGENLTDKLPLKFFK